MVTLKILHCSSFLSSLHVENQFRSAKSNFLGKIQDNHEFFSNRISERYFVNISLFTSRKMAKEAQKGLIHVTKQKEN